MKRGIRRISFILAILLLVSMIPLKAVADELSPYVSVERPEDGVVIYHNKDGSYTMVVGAAADSGKTRGAKGSGAADTEEVQVQIEKQFREGLPLATIEYAGDSLSFFPVVSKQEEDMWETTEEAEEQDAEDEGSGLIPSVDVGSIYVVDETETEKENILGNETENDGLILSDNSEEQDFAQDVTTGVVTDEANIPEDDENQGTEAQRITYIASFIIPQDKEGQLLPLKELIVPIDTDEEELSLPERLEAIDSEGSRIRVSVYEWKIYRGVYGDQQKEWILFPVIDGLSPLFVPALSEAIEKDIFTALPHVIVRWIEDDQSHVEQEEDEDLLDQAGEEDLPAVESNDSEESDEQPKEGTVDEALKTVFEGGIPEEGALQPNADENDPEGNSSFQSNDSADAVSEQIPDEDISSEEDLTSGIDESDLEGEDSVSTDSRIDADAFYSFDRDSSGIQVLSVRRHSSKMLANLRNGRNVSQDGDSNYELTTIQGEQQGNDSVVYRDLFGEGIDLCLYSTATGIKEVVRIGSYSPDAVYRYTLHMDGLTPVQMGQEIGLFKDTIQVGKIHAPYMTDESGAYCSDISVSMYGKGDGVFELVYVPDDEWLASEERMYPVKLDPTIEFTGSTTHHMEDNYVSSKEPSNNFTYNATEILAGGVYTAYIRPVYVDALSTTSPVLIKSASLNLYCKKGSGTLRLHQVQGAWDSRSITYNTAPSYGDTISTKSVSQGKVTWDITVLFSHWFHSLDQAGSFGVALEGSV